MAKNSSHITRQQLFIPPLFLTASGALALLLLAGKAQSLLTNFNTWRRRGKPISSAQLCTATHVGSIYSGRGSDTTVIIFVNGLNRDVAIRASQVRNLLKCLSPSLCIVCIFFCSTASVKSTRPYPRQDSKTSNNRVTSIDDDLSGRCCAYGAHIARCEQVLV